MPNIWKVEPHAHTAQISLCGKLSAQQMVKLVAACDYNAVFVTDHYTPDFFERRKKGADYLRALTAFLGGYRIAKDQGDTLGIAVFPALEIRIGAGPEDYLLYGVDPQELAQMGYLADLSLADLSRVIRQTPHGLLFQAHPFRSYLRPQDPNYLDGIEVCNANPRHDSRNPLALAMANEYNLLHIAGSDVHQSNDPGNAGVYCPPFSTVEQFTSHLKSGKVTCFGDIAS